MANNKMYQMMQESAQWKEQLDKEKTLPLQWDEFFGLMKKRKAEIKKFKPLEEYNNALKFTLHPDESTRMKTDEVFAKKTENWMKSLKRDFYLLDAVYTVSQIKK